VDTQNTDSLNRLTPLKFPVNPAYLKPPEPATNDLGLPVKDYYITADLCKVLRLLPDTFRYRIRTGKYPESRKIGGKRRFT